VKLWPLVAAALSTRERDVAYALLAGLSGREIGQAIGLNHQAVKAHLAAMYRKFQLPLKRNRNVLLVVTLYGYCDHK
jgi:DNA-binding NarL/FixJ family response regulator